MQIKTVDDVTPAVLAVMQQTDNPRLREILTSMVKHLHGFIREVGLTEKEFREATAILNDIGQLKSDTHDEFVLMCGSLGISSLVCLMNNGNHGQTETAQSLLGPFWRMHSPRVENGGSLIRSETPGASLYVKGTVVNRAGQPVANAEVDVWHASPIGLYENQDATQADMNLRGKFTTDENGCFWFWTVKMIGYPIPTNGVVGRLLAAQNRHPYRPAHLHALIYKEGYKTLISQVFDPECPWVDSDVQFGVTRALLGNFVRHDAPCPDNPAASTPWYALEHTYVMEEGVAALPRAPIK